MNRCKRLVGREKYLFLSVLDKENYACFWSRLFIGVWGYVMGVLFLLCFSCRADYRKCRAFEDALAIHKGILGNQYRWIFKYIKVFGWKAGGLFLKAGEVFRKGGGLFPDLSFCVGKNIKGFFLFCGVPFPEESFYEASGHCLEMKPCIILQDFWPWFWAGTI